MDPAAHSPQRNVTEADSMPRRVGKAENIRMHDYPPLQKSYPPFSPFIFSFQKKINILKFVTLTKGMR